MKEHAFQSLLVEGFVPFKVTVLVIARNGVALRGQMHANLVRSSGFDGDFQQGAAFQALCHFDQGDRAHAVGVVACGHTDTALTVW